MAPQTSRCSTPDTASLRRSASGGLSREIADYLRRAAPADRAARSLPRDRRLGADGREHRRSGKSAPRDQRTHERSIPVTYVPFRNAHFLSVAVSWAEAIGAGAIYIGAVAEDSSGYPDCRPEYYRAFQEVIREGTRPETQIEIMTPVITLKKSEIIRRGMELGAPLHLTWSCYQSEDVACGACDSCLLRLRAFAEAGVADPYRTGGRLRLLERRCAWNPQLNWG